MNIKKEDDLVTKIKTPTTLISKHISLGEKDNHRSVSQTSKWSKHCQSSQSLSYSDSFDSDSPPKSSAIHRTKRTTKSIYHLTSIQNKKAKKVVSGISKAGEGTQKLLEASQIEMNALISENADLRRQLYENINELKTVQNQNKIQEKYLNKANSRDADVPSLISRYNSELHSLQEQLRRKKEKLDAANRQKADLDLELSKMKKKVDKLKALVFDKQLKEREELTKKVASLNDLLEAEVKKNTDLERSMELLSKKHSYQMSMEVNKFKELKQTYADVLIELKNIRCNLNEKTKLLEMQNIYSKKVVRAPHRLSGGKGKVCELDESNFSVSKTATVPPLKSSSKKEDGKYNTDIEDQSQKVSTSKVKNYFTLRKNKQTPNTAVQSEINNDKKLEENKTQSEVLFFGDTPPEISEVDEKAELKFSEVFEAVRRNMHSDTETENKRLNEGIAKKTDLLAKLKMIDERKKTKSSTNHNMKSGLMENDNENIKEDTDSDELDVFCTSDSENDEFSDKKSDSSSPCLLIPRGHGRLMKSKNSLRNKKDTKFEFLGFSVNSNNSNSEGEILICHFTEKESKLLTPDYEEIKID